MTVPFVVLVLVLIFVGWTLSMRAQSCGFTFHCKTCDYKRSLKIRGHDLSSRSKELQTLRDVHNHHEVTFSTWEEY